MINQQKVLPVSDHTAVMIRASDDFLLALLLRGGLTEEQERSVGRGRALLKQLPEVFPHLNLDIATTIHTVLSLVERQARTVCLAFTMHHVTVTVEDQFFVDNVRKRRRFDLKWRLRRTGVESFLCRFSSYIFPLMIHCLTSDDIQIVINERPLKRRRRIKKSPP